jgi:hypothetical protein
MKHMNPLSVISFFSSRAFLILVLHKSNQMEAMTRGDMPECVWKSSSFLCSDILAVSCAQPQHSTDPFSKHQRVTGMMTWLQEATKGSTKGLTKGAGFTEFGFE